MRQFGKRKQPPGGDAAAELAKSIALKGYLVLDNSSTNAGSHFVIFQMRLSVY